KAWTEHEDRILSSLSRYLVDRKLFRIYQSSQPFEKEFIDNFSHTVERQLGLRPGEGQWFVATGTASTNIYDSKNAPVYLREASGRLTELSLKGNPLPPEIVETRYYICYPRELDINF
ncbi:MAG: hypothetical protein GX459_06320, partial [Bacteroidales bacterium]|nr:hypothetical protein [Bacteroidales bacterium]